MAELSKSKIKIPVSEPRFWGSEKKYVQDCMDTNWVSSMGKYVTEFEEKFKSFAGCKYSTSCINGTAAIHLALMALGIKEGDEVIIPSFTIICTANTVILQGAKPVLVDVEKDTMCINPKLIEEKITSRTRAIMVVHMYGHPAKMDEIQAIAKKHKIAIIEDCCESHGAEFKGKRTGCLSDIAVFSFYSNKIIVTGEGGMLTSNNKELIDKAALYKNQAFTKTRFLHDEIGFNYRMTNLHAAIGVAQMEHADKIVEEKRKLAKKYIEKLKKVAKYCQLPYEAEWAKSVFWMIGIVLKDNVCKSKEQVMQELLDKYGIDTRSFFFSMHQQPVYKNGSKMYKSVPDTKGQYPVSEWLSNRGFYLPSSMSLTDEQMDYVVDSLKEVLESK